MYGNFSMTITYANSYRNRNFFFPRANFKGFFNPRDEEISIPDIRLIRKSLIPVWVSISDGHWKISIHFQKIREIVGCTFSFPHEEIIFKLLLFDKFFGHAEIWFPHGQNFICCGLTSFLSFFYKFLLENTCTSKKFPYLTIGPFGNLISFH